MSTIIAAKAVDANGENVVVMVADKQVTCGNTKECMSDNLSKIIKKGDMLIGIAGHLRATNIVEHIFQVPEIEDDQKPIEYLAKQFIPALRETYKQEAYSENDKGKDVNGSTIIIGFKGNVYEISSDYAVTENNRKFMSIGSGSQYATGACAVEFDKMLNAPSTVEDVISLLFTAISVAARNDIYTNHEHDIMVIS